MATARELKLRVQIESFPSCFVTKCSSAGSGAFEEVEELQFATVQKFRSILRLRTKQNCSSRSR